MEETHVLYQVDQDSYHELMEEAQKLARFGAWEVNILTSAVKWSAEMYHMLGYDPLITKATFKNFIKKLHREDIAYVKANLEKLLNNHSTDTYDFRVVNSNDGSIKYLRTGIIVKRDLEGKAVSMTGFSQDITAQKLAERSIDKVNRDLNIFFNTIDDVFFSLDITNRKVIQVSYGCEKIYGYSVRELLSHYDLWMELAFPEDLEIIKNGDIRLMKGETVVNQYRIVRKDKVVRWVESKIIPTRDRLGKLIRLDGVTRDITDRKNAELQHERTEKWYRQIVESAQEGIWTIDENNQTNFVNKKMCEILGYSADEMMGKELFYFMTEEDRRYAEICMERRRNGAKENLDIRYITKTGEYVWANITANPIFDEQGTYKGALAMVTDITERRMSEESLKRSEANLRTVFDNTDVGFVLFSKDLHVVSFNSQADDFYIEHFDKKLKAGINALKEFPKHKGKLLGKIIEKVKNHEIVSYETNYHTKNNEVKWYDVKWVGVLNERSGLIGLLKTFKNITEKKLLELEREKITTELIQRNKDQEQFNYMVSHNLRAPVANIIGLSELMMDMDITEEEKQEILNGISTSVKNLDAVIIDMNHVLQVKELINETKEAIELKRLVNEIRLSLNDLIQKEQVQITYKFGVESVFTIRSYLYSIFYNLILNSIKYRQCEVPPVIEIKSDLYKNKIELTFTDNGKGIDLDNSKELFGLYRRFDTTVEGKGIGLFMVKTQVESLGGTIKVNSEMTKGTQFIIQLPI